MANRSNRRRVSLSRAMAFEAAFPISPRRADAHHGQEAPPSANRPDIRAQSHLGARTSVCSCKPRDQVLISLPDPKPGRHRSIRCEAERAELSTAARPPACQRGAQPARRPWITPRTSSEPETPTAFPCLLGGVHIHPRCTCGHSDRRQQDRPTQPLDRRRGNTSAQERGRRGPGQQERTHRLGIDRPRRCL